MAEKQPHLQVDKRDGVTVVDLLDREILDEITINEITESLFAVVEDNSPIRLVLNFEHVTHLSSSALGTLIRLNKRIEQDDGKFCLCAIRPQLYQIFVITKLNKVFHIYDDVKEAQSRV